MDAGQIDFKAFPTTPAAAPDADYEVANKKYADTTQFNAQTGTTYTLALSDKNKLVTMSNTSANTLTVPLNSSVAFPYSATDCTVIAIQMINTGVTTIEGATGVTINGVSAGSATLAQWDCITLTKVGENTWLAVGGTFA